MARFCYCVGKLLLLVSLVLSVSLPGYAQKSCDHAHRNLSPYTLEMRVDRTSLEMEKNREAAIDHLASGGGFKLNERNLNPKDSAAVVELVKMIAATRSTKFSYKEFKGKEFGTIVLGIPLRNKYSLEVSYRSDYRDGKKTYVAKSATLITPSGHADIAHNNLQHIEGGLIDKLSIDLSDYPGIRDNNYQINIPAEISGNALLLFERKFAKKLDLIEDKDKLNQIASYNNYHAMKWHLKSIAFWAKIKEYHAKGVFKTYVKWIAVPAFLGAMVFSGDKIAPETTQATRLQVKNFIQYVIHGPQNPWLKASLDQFAMAEHIPAGIKGQIRDLQADFMKNAEDPQITAALNKQYSPNINSSSKFQVDKDQYMWVSTEFDKARGKQVTLLFITQDNKYGQLEYAVAEIDRQKYEPLIKFLESKGQFLPLESVTQ